MIESILGLAPATAYISVFLMMLTNGIVNFPSSQILYIFVGYISTLGTYSMYYFIIFGSVGNTLGNIALYEIVRKNRRHILGRIVPNDVVNNVHFKNMLDKHGTWYIFFGKVIPGLKVFMPIVAAIFSLTRSKVYLALAAASLLWASVLISIGRVFGKDTDITKWYTLIILCIVSFGYIYMYRRYPELFKRPDDIIKPK